MKFFCNKLPRAQATGCREDRPAPRTVNGIDRRHVERRRRDGGVIRPLNNPLVASNSLAVLRGDLAPDGADHRDRLGDPRPAQHQDKAVVFGGCDDMAARIDDPDLDVDGVSVLCCARQADRSTSMPIGRLPFPRKILAEESATSTGYPTHDGAPAGPAYLHVAPILHRRARSLWCATTMMEQRAAAPGRADDDEELDPAPRSLEAAPHATAPATGRCSITSTRPTRDRFDSRAARHSDPEIPRPRS